MSCCCGGVGTDCCPNAPATLYLTISGSGSIDIDGTYALTWNSNQYSGQTADGCAIQLYCNVNTNPPICGFSLVVFCNGAPNCNLCYEVSTCGTTSGTWIESSASCSPFYLQSNLTDRGDGNDTITFTVTL